MPENVNTESPPSMASLVGGIITDAQELIRKEVTLARREIQEEFLKAKTAVVSFAIGMAVLVLSGLMFCMMLVYLLHWAYGPDLPLWGCFAIVGGLFVLVGGVFFYIAKTKINQIDLVPHQTVETMKENVQWIKNQT